MPACSIPWSTLDYYRNCIGLPHYPPDSFDNDLTFPIEGHYERVNGTFWKKI